MSDEYIFYNLETLSNIDNDIIIAIGKKNNPTIIKFGLDSRIIELNSILPELKQYTTKEIFIGLALLNVKQLIIMEQDAFEILEIEEKIRNFVSPNTSKGGNEHSQYYILARTLNFMKHLLIDEVAKANYLDPFTGLMRNVIDNVKAHDGDLVSSIEHLFDIDKLLGMKYIRLTFNLKGVTGVQMFNHIVSMNELQRIADIALKAKDDTSNIKAKVEEIDTAVKANIKKNKNIEDNIHKSLLKNVEAISIFVAVITLIIETVPNFV